VVLARVLHAGLREHGGHGARAEQPLGGDAAGAPAAATQQAASHRLDARPRAPDRRAFTDSHASRNAVAPVAQAFAQFTTGMPVWPICRRMRWPIIALAWYRLPHHRPWMSPVDIDCSLPGCAGWKKYET
jgi:hypothetical protein